MNGFRHYCHCLDLRGKIGFFSLVILWVLVACAPQPPQPSPGHLQTPPARLPTDDIPPPVQRPSYIPLPPPSASISETYSVVITDMPVKDLLMALANDAKMNVDIYPGISGNVTLNAIDQTLPQILDRIAKQVDIYYEIQGSHLVITPNSPIVRTYKVGYVNMSRDGTSNIDISTQIISSLDQVGGGAEGGGAGGGGGGGGGDNNSTTTIKNVSNNRFWETLESNISAILSESSTTQATTGKNSNVIISPESSLVTIRATRKKHEEVQRFLDQVMDSVLRQVLIEATVVEVNLSDTYQAGIDWRRIAGDFNYTQSLLSGSIETSPFYSISYNNQNSKFGDVSATIRLLQQFGNVKVLSSPKIMALNNQTAVLKVVDNVVYFNITANLTSTDITRNTGTTNTNIITTTYGTTINTVPVGLIMNVTPQISDNDVVTLNVRPTISRINKFVNDPNPDLAKAGVESLIPEIQVREMESVLRINNGDIAIMGGLMQDTTSQQRTGVPVLSQLPLVGDLFSYRNDQYTKTELVIFLRPVVIKQASVDGDLSDYRTYLPSPSQPDVAPPTGLIRP